MITLTKIRDLNLSAPTTAQRFSHLSAASGLACINSFIYVVADDELHLLPSFGNRPHGHAASLTLANIVGQSPLWSDDTNQRFWLANILTLLADALNIAILGLGPHRSVQD